MRILLEMLEFIFNIIAISERKLKNKPLVDINLTGYHAPYCKYTEANKGGTLLYVNKELNYTIHHIVNRQKRIKVGHYYM